MEPRRQKYLDLEKELSIERRRNRRRARIFFDIVAFCILAAMVGAMAVMRWWLNS